MHLNQKKILQIYLLLILIIIIGISGCSTSVKTQTNKLNTNGLDTSKLKIYSNTKFSYQISYPLDIITDQTPEANDVFFRFLDKTQQDKYYMVISTHFNPDALSPEDYLKKNYEEWLGAPSSFSDFHIIEPITVNGLRVIKFITVTDQYIMFGKGKYIFAIRGNYTKVISTFKFKEPTSHVYDSDYEPYTSDWKFYSSDQYPFSFNYPKNWNISFDSKKVLVYDNYHELSVVVSKDKPPDFIYGSTYKESIKVGGFNAVAYTFPSEFYIPIQKDNLWYIIKGKGNLRNIEFSLYGNILYTFTFIEPQQY